MVSGAKMLIGSLILIFEFSLQISTKTTKKNTRYLSYIYITIKQYSKNNLVPTFSITYLPKHFPIYYIVITEVGRFAKLIFLNEKPIHYPIYTFQHFDRIFNGKLLIGDICTNVDNFLFRRNFPLYYFFVVYRCKVQ